MKPPKNNTGYCVGLLFLLLSLCCSNALRAQLVAGFGASPVSGCAPLVVQFSDSSTGNITSWKWDLGNGTISSQRNPTTTYFTAGNYTVTLTVSNSNGSNTLTKTQYIKVYDKPVVRFTASDTIDCIPFSTLFTDQSVSTIGTINSWAWDFDDGGTSSQRNPSHTYTQSGNYNITLRVTNNGGCSNSLSKLAYIKAADSIRTQFIFTKPIQCKPPETIRFTNNTVGPGPISYQWSFGDGGTSTIASPSHTYTTGGLYSIQLIARNNLGCKDTLLLKDTLFIKNVQTSFTGPDTVCARKRVFYTNTTIPAPLSSKWTFSDGTSSFGNITAKIWNSPGNYNIKLTSNYSNCSDSITKNIVVLGTPTLSFSSDDSASCKAPFTVNFSAITAGAVAWNWDFGDGGTSNQQNPTYTYNSTGRFDVRLTVTNAAGCTATLTQYKFIKVEGPVVDFDPGEGGGCIPFIFKPYPTVTSVDGISSYQWDFGNGNTSANMYPTEIYPLTGTYTVKLFITSNDGCVDSMVKPAAVRTGTPPVVNFGAAPRVVCPGVNVQFTDSSAPADKWLWTFGDGGSSGDQNPQHMFADTARYTIKLVVWNNGCKDSLTKFRYISVLPGYARFRPIYNCTNKREVYFKDSSILPQSWFWDFGDGNTSTLQNPTHVFSGYQNYLVSLTTTNAGCSNRRLALIKTINEIPDFITSRDTLCRDDSTFFYLKNLNKKNLSRFTWDFGDGITDTTSTDSVSHIYSAAGLYTVTLTATDINGCTETTIKKDMIHVFGPVAGFRLNGTGGCSGKTVSFTDTSSTQQGFNNIAKWMWDFGDGQKIVFNGSPPVPVTHVYSSSGAYYPSLSVIDSAGCSDSVSYSRPVNIFQPTANFFSPNFNTCTIDTVIFRNPSTGNRLQYLWSFGDNSTSTDSLPAKKYNANGDYSVKLVVTDAQGCKDSMTKPNYIKVRTVTASFTVSDSVGTCTPFEVRFRNTSSNALSQLWEFGDGGFSSTTNPTYYYTVAGTYYAKLTARRSANCFSTDSIKIKTTAPSASLHYTPVQGCAPLSVSFNVSTRDVVSFIWDLNDGTSFLSYDSTYIHTYTQPGRFLPSVVVKDTTGCIVPLIGTDTIAIYSTKVNFGASQQTFCDNGTTTFSDSSVAGSSISSYQWDFGDGQTANIQNPTHRFSAPGAYNIKLLISTTYGCVDSLVKPSLIKVVASPQVNISNYNSSYCGPASILFTGNWLNPDTSLMRWQWNFGNGGTYDSLLAIPQQYTDTGYYTVHLSVINSSGCTGSASGSFRINPVPATSAGNDTAICAGSTAALHASGADNYTWGASPYLSCTNCSNPVSALPVSGSHIVTGSNSFGCTKPDTVNIYVKQPFTLTHHPDAATICAGQSVQLQAAGADFYQWYPPAGLNNAAIANPVAAPAVSAQYKVVATDSMQCFYDTAYILVTVNPNPSVNAGADILLNTGKEVTLTPVYSPDVTNWLWQPAAGLSCTSCPNPVAYPQTGMQYSITVTNNNGCKATDSIYVQVKCDKSSIYLPSAFTPNNDGRNDYFYPVCYGILTIIDFKIFNRYGQLVYQNANFAPNDKSKGWNGKYNGADMPAGTYVYVIEYICGNKEITGFTGNILLLR